MSLVLKHYACSVIVMCGFMFGHQVISFGQAIVSYATLANYGAEPALDL